MKNITLINIVLVSLMLGLFKNKLMSQDIEQIIHAKPIKCSGGLSIDQIYAPSNLTGGDTTQPYQIFITADLNPVLFDVINLPLSFSYSNRKFDADYPISQETFNQFGLSPSYKWLKVHAGWRNMTFSKYSLSGIPFLGGGIELTPGNLEFKMFYGRISKAIEIDTSEAGSTPSYERLAAGIQLNYKNKGNKYGISFFRSNDEETSLKKSLDSLLILPEDNFIFTVLVNQKIFKKLTANIEYGRSIVTHDSRVDSLLSTFTNSNLYIRTNQTTAAYNAFNAGLSYKLKQFNIGIEYERIDPGYEAHGAYFYNNDFENITLNLGIPLFTNKLLINLKGGLENDNLDNNKSSSSTRFVGQANVNYKITEKLQIGANYSNFRNISIINPTNSYSPSVNPYDEIDSLRYAQVSQNASINSSYNTTTDKFQNNLVLFGSFMNTNDIQGDSTLNTSNFYSSSINYTCSHIVSKISCGIGLNFSWNNSSYDTTGTLGPTVNLGIVYLQNKARTVISYSLYNNLTNSQNYSQTIQLISSLNIKKYHSFSFSALLLNKKQNIESELNNSDSQTSYSLRLTYRFSF